MTMIPGVAYRLGPEPGTMYPASGWHHAAVRAREIAAQRRAEATTLIREAEEFEAAADRAEQRARLN